MRRFALLDRDGTIIRKYDYLADPDLVELIPGTAEALRHFRRLGLGLVVISNQSGIGRGLLDEACVAAIHRRLQEILAAEEITLDGIYHCPHRPHDGCRCRKPLPGMVEQAARELNFDPAQCIVLGDNRCDVELGRAIGAATILVRTGHGAEMEPTVQADFVADDLAAAVPLVERWLPT